MESCKFCGKALPEGTEGGHTDSWPDSGWCGAECAFRFHTFTRPKKEGEVTERNRAMEEILQGFRASLALTPDKLPAEDPQDDENPRLRIVLEVIEGEIQYAYADRAPVEILVALHGAEGDEIHLPRGKPPGPLVVPSILGAMEIKLDSTFVAEVFRRAEGK